MIVTFDSKGQVASWDGRSGIIATTQESVDLLGDVLGLELEPTVQKTFDLLNETSVIRDSFAVVGATEHVLNGTSELMRIRETNLGRLISDSYLWFGQEYADANQLPPAQIALVNTGGIRGRLTGSRQMYPSLTS